MRGLSSIFLFGLLSLCALGQTPDVTIPARYLPLLKTTDFVEVTGTNDLGGAENFTIHNSKAIGQFVQFLTSDRYTAVPKSLKPEFKSLSAYQVRLSAKGQVVLQFRVIADTILDIPAESSFYMQSDRYSDNLMAPLLRLR
jgi:hypothetical protein